MARSKTRFLRRTCIGLAAASLVWAAGSSLAAARRTSRDEWQQPDRVMVDLNLKPGAKVADVGAGRGYFTFRLAEAVGEKGRVYATEISEKAIRSVADRIKKDSIRNVEVVISEPTNTKLDANSLDAAVSCMGLHHVPKDIRGPLTKDICRALKPGGYFYILDWRVDSPVPHEKDRRIPKADLVKLATDAGMTFDAEFLYLSRQVFLRLRKPSQTK